MLSKLNRYKKTIICACITIIIIVLVILGVHAYNENKKELIPDNTLNFATTTYYTNFINEIDTFDRAVTAFGNITDTNDNFFNSFQQSYFDKNGWREDLNNMKSTCNSLNANYKSNKTQDSYITFQDSVKLAKLIDKTTDKLLKILDDNISDDEKVKYSKEIRETYDNTILPLSQKISNRIEDTSKRID